MMDQFNSAETACSISADAYAALSDFSTRDVYGEKAAGVKRDAARSQVLADLDKIQADFGQDAINVLGNQLDLQDIRARERTNDDGDLLPRVCPEVKSSELPGVIVGRNQDNQVTEITFMRNSYSFDRVSNKLTWKRAE